MRRTMGGRIVYGGRPYKVSTATHHAIQPARVSGRLSEQTLFEGQPGFFAYGVDQCGARRSGYHCTRESGHDGAHAAHVHAYEQVATWRATR